MRLLLNRQLRQLGTESFHRLISFAAPLGRDGHRFAEAFVFVAIGLRLGMETGRFTGHVFALPGELLTDGLCGPFFLALRGEGDLRLLHRSAGLFHKIGFFLQRTARGLDCRLGLGNLGRRFGQFRFEAAQFRLPRQHGERSTGVLSDEQESAARDQFTALRRDGALRLCRFQLPAGGQILNDMRVFKQRRNQVADQWLCRDELGCVSLDTRRERGGTRRALRSEGALFLAGQFFAPDLGRGIIVQDERVHRITE